MKVAGKGGLPPFNLLKRFIASSTDLLEISAQNTSWETEATNRKERGAHRRVRVARFYPSSIWPSHLLCRRKYRTQYHPHANSHELAPTEGQFEQDLSERSTKEGRLYGLDPIIEGAQIGNGRRLAIFLRMALLSELVVELGDFLTVLLCIEKHMSDVTFDRDRPRRSFVDSNITTPDFTDKKTNIEC